jgi:hypothetical protein
MADVVASDVLVADSWWLYPAGAFGDTHEITPVSLPVRQAEIC